MQNAMVRINQMQDEMGNKVKQVHGAEEYIQEKMRLFKESEALNSQIKSIEQKERKLTESFFISYSFDTTISKNKTKEDCSYENK